MSFTAINDVTKALAQLIESQIQLEVGAAAVTLLPPGDTLPEQTGVNLYLYRVSRSPHLSNDPWRGDRITPPSGRPVLGLSLHYLLTPLGRPADASAAAGDVSHTMLGLAMLTLFEHPVLNDVHITGFDADVSLSLFLLNSYEQIRVSLSPASVDDLSKIWATINKPYRLSVAYEVSLVELVPTTPPAGGGGVVLTPQIDVTPLTAPTIIEVGPQPVAPARIVGGVVTPNSVDISGVALGNTHRLPVVRVGGILAELAAVPTAPFTSITARLPLDLATGPRSEVDVRVGGRAAEPASLELSPWLSTVRPVRTALDPALAADGTLQITGPGLPPVFQIRYDGQAGALLRPAALAAGVATASIPALQNGTYQVRIQLPTGELSNALVIVVLPRLDPAVVLTAAGGGHHIALSGARLNGTTIGIVVDGVEYASPQTTVTPGALSHQFSRLLSVGTHSVIASIDGIRSRPITITV